MPKCKRFIKLITMLFLFAILFLLSSCSGGTSMNQSSLVSQTTSTSGEAFNDAEVVEVGEMSKGVTVGKLSESLADSQIFTNPSFCQVDFSLDSGNSVTAAYTPNTKSILELVDESGATWQLVIHPYSLDQPVTIKMTALKGITSEDAPVPYSGGVLLEPDGLVFLTPASLKISGSKTQDTVVLTGSSQGDSMAFILDNSPDEGFSIAHFSTLVATDRGSLRKQQS